jgi:putative ABC transport system substrate-binding protein
MRRRGFATLVGAVVATRPLTSRGQQKAMPVVGFLSPQAPGAQMAARLAGFAKGLAELNYVEGENIALEYRWAEGHYDRLSALANDLIGRKVTVIAALTQDAALAARAATSTVPIVFNVGGDPTKIGLVASMNRPGGNATGVSMFSYLLDSKRLTLLHELEPKATSVGLLVNPNNASAADQERDVQLAARTLGLRIDVRRVGSVGELDAVFDGLVQAGTQAVLAGADPFFANQREKLVALAAKHGLPAIWEWPDFVEAGGLASYGTDIVDNYRQAGVYTARILRGEKPADLPVVRPVNFVLAINQATARALGLELSPTLLARADQVIE